MRDMEREKDKSKRNTTDDPYLGDTTGKAPVLP
jgi:hypothetical protein